MDNLNQKDSAASRYETLRITRDAFLKRAREAAILTIPSLMPPEGFNATSDTYKSFQDLGKRGVNNLASKILLALFPPNSPFSRFKFSDKEIEEAIETNKDFKSQMEEALAKSERVIQDEVETTGIRADSFEVLKHLIVAGNRLVYKRPKGGIQSYPLSDYCVLRDREGNVLEIVLKESVTPQTLPMEYQKLCKPAEGSPEKLVDLFTHIFLEDGEYQHYQSVKDVVISETIGTYPKDGLPWYALRWIKIDGESYGRGHIEETCFGDLTSLEGLYQAIVEGSAAAAKVIFLVDPNGDATPKALAETRNGGFAPGRAEQVTALQLNKFNDFRVSLETIDRIEARVSKAFLLNSSVQRSGERVTAEEIRFLANELETALGGTYAVLAQEYQLPLVKGLIKDLQRKRKLPKFPNSVRPMIVTGLEALGRNHDLIKLEDFISDMAAKFGPESLPKYINVGVYFSRRAVALGIETKDLLKTPEQIAQDEQAAQQANALQSIAPNLVNQVGNLAATNTKVNAQAAQVAAQAQPQ